MRRHRAGSISEQHSTRALQAPGSSAEGSLLLAVFAFESIWGGGHPSLSGMLLVWGLYSTLTLYLARALLGVEFPPPDLMIVGFLEYALVGFGLASLVARLRGKVVARGRTAIVAFLIYMGAQVAAHVLLNLQSVNVRLMADTNPAVSIGAVNRIRESGDTAAVPVLQQKLIADFEREGRLESSMLDALTVLGGAKGWQDLLDSGRLGVAGPAARAWRVIAEKVRDIANPWVAETLGGVQSPDFTDEDITRLFDSLALALVERLQSVPDSEASLTLLSVMKERPDLCRKYFAFVPIGLRDTRMQVPVDVVRMLALMKAGPSSDGQYDYQERMTNDEMSRFDKDRPAVAEEWIVWAKSNTPCR
jgi:hypothetical protein